MSLCFCYSLAEIEILAKSSLVKNLYHRNITHHWITSVILNFKCHVYNDGITFFRTTMKVVLKSLMGML